MSRAPSSPVKGPRRQLVQRAVAIASSPSLHHPLLSAIMASSQKPGRPVQSVCEVSGPYAVNTKSCKALLEHIDWSNHIGSDIWTREYPPRQALQEVIDCYKPEKLAGSHVRDWIVLQDVDTLFKTASTFMSKHGRKFIGGAFKGRSARYLFRDGSKAILQDSLAEMEYQWGTRVCSRAATFLLRDRTTNVH